VPVPALLLLVAALWTGALLRVPLASAATVAACALALAVAPAAGIRPAAARPEGGDGADGAGGGGGRARWRVVVLAVGLAAVGAAGVGWREARLEGGVLGRLAAGGGAAEVQAVVATEPRTAAGGSWAVVRVDRVGERAVPGSGRALVRFGDGPPADVGDRVTGRCAAARLGRDGFEGHVRRLSAGVALRCAEPVVRTGAATGPAAAANAVRGRFATAARARLDRDPAALLTGLVLGDVRGQSPEVRDQFASAGLTHLTAVSGSNVALLTAGVLGAAAAVGLGARGRVALALAAVAWFTVLVRAEPSVLRAAAMAALVLAARVLGRGSAGAHTLLAGVLVLLLVDPFLAGQIGFALSVAATAGVLVVAPALADRLPGPAPLRTALATTVGAQLAVAPLLIALPGGVPLWSVPANLIAAPAAAAATAVGVAVALVAQVAAAPAALLAPVAAPPLAVVLWSARTFAGGPSLHPTPATLALLAAVALAAPLVRRRAVAGGEGEAPRSPRAPRLRVGVAAVAAVVVVAAAVRPALRDAGDITVLTVTALDVGQGDAVLVEVPAGGGRPAGRLLVDGGPDPGAALAALRALGVDRLDAVALSHAHADHSDGLPAVLDRLPVGALLVGPRPPGPGAASSAVEVREIAARRAVPVLPLAAGDRLALGGAGVEVLSPPPGGLPAGENDNSLVLRVEAHGAVALLTGDAEVGAQRRLLRAPDRLRADVLKVPHHGGDTNAPGFLAAVDPAVAVIGVGDDNDYGHPTREVLDALAGAVIVRTDRDGTLPVPVRSTADPAVPPLRGRRGEDRSRGVVDRVT